MRPVVADPQGNLGIAADLLQRICDEAFDEIRGMNENYVKCRLCGEFLDLVTDHKEGCPVFEALDFLGQIECDD